MFITQPRAKKNALPVPPRKKRKAEFAIEEISFDNDARADYLTGFHKRKVQRQKQAQEIAVEKARQEKIAFRKQLREQRQQAAEAHVQQVNEALREARRAGGDITEDEGGKSGEDDDSSDDVWTGFNDEQPPPPPPPPDFVDHEEEYIDEDRFTTVTVEAVDVDRDGMHRLAGRSAEDGSNNDDNDDDDDDDDDDNGDKEARGDGAHKDGGKDQKKVWPKKTKKKKFRYENKIERRMTRQKQKKPSQKR
ncbi:protein required for cell viability [Niveomyces insectorum RCEF 264]|uniref:Protein required for cell viability n=1 Tax=Niveomyces insectorum RCEF 264 TaxID=1081102 RepID=A0A167RV62_9HYPO|nr:protein required for cell viability [Niveomyces insectorum RCEF 264]